MRALWTSGVRHSQTKPFIRFSPRMYLFGLNWFIAAVMAGARERQDHTSEGRCRSNSDARKHVGLDQHVCFFFSPSLLVLNRHRSCRQCIPRKAKKAVAWLFGRFLGIYT